jgi:hypothetical protein
MLTSFPSRVELVLRDGQDDAIDVVVIHLPALFRFQQISEVDSDAVGEAGKADEPK